MGNVGSVHDQRVFRISEVHDLMVNSSKFPNNGHIIIMQLLFGASQIFSVAAYKINEHLFVPYRDNSNLTLKHDHFIFYLSSARKAIER